MITLTTVLFALIIGKPSPDYRHLFPLPNVTAPSGWGVNIHFTDPRPGEIQKLATAGFKWVRMDFVWSRIETRKGQYDFSAYDRLMAALNSVGIRPLFILDYGNDLYQKGSPNTDDSRAAFCRFVEASVMHFRHRGAIWEMWNEPNITFWQPKPNVDEYVALAKKVGKAIRSTTPDEWFIGPGVSGFDWTFLQNCVDSGLLTYWDAVSIHPYRGSEPETVPQDWMRLRSMIDAKSHSGRSTPMISSEWGYPAQIGGIGPERQAAFAVRQYLTNLMCGVPLSILYDWKNDGSSQTDPESNFGTVTSNLAPKPAYMKIQQICRSLRGFSFKSRLIQDSEQDYVLLFQRGKAAKIVFWTTSQTPRKATPHLGLDSQEVQLS